MKNVRSKAMAKATAAARPSEPPTGKTSVNKAKVEPSTIQNNHSFHEHTFAIKIYIDTIKYYFNICQSSMVKSCTIRGYAGCGKS